MRKTNENKQANSTKNCGKNSESKNVKNGGGKGCGKSSKDCK